MHARLGAASERGGGTGSVGTAAEALTLGRASEDRTSARRDASRRDDLDAHLYTFGGLFGAGNAWRSMAWDGWGEEGQADAVWRPDEQHSDESFTSIAAQPVGATGSPWGLGSAARRQGC